MDPTPVVTCFLRNDGQVLLLRRSESVGSYAGLWGGVAGHVAPDREADPAAYDPAAAARREIDEETGLGEAVSLVRQGDPFDVRDDRGRAWEVHPFLFDCASRAVEPNRETSEWAWLHPPEIRRRETVPELWESYDRVRPTVDSIRADRAHGAAWLSIRALEVLRDEAALAEDDAPLDTLARALREARPAMTVIENRVARVVAGAIERTPAGEQPTPATVEAAARETIETAVTADREAAAVAAEALSGLRLCTLSRSGTVRAAIERADPEAVLVAESRPGGEGVGVAESLTDRFDVTLTSDAALASQIADWRAEAVVVGADTVLADGRVLNKVGTRAAALAAAREGIPCYAVAATDKVSPETKVHGEPAPDPIYEGAAPISVANPLFEVTPADLFAGVCTEDGLLDTSAVTEVASRHRDRREW